MPITGTIYENTSPDISSFIIDTFVQGGPSGTPMEDMQISLIRIPEREDFLSRSIRNLMAVSHAETNSVGEFNLNTDRFLPGSTAYIVVRKKIGERPLLSSGSISRPSGISGGILGGANMDQPDPRMVPIYSTVYRSATFIVDDVSNPVSISYAPVNIDIPGISSTDIFDLIEDGQPLLASLLTLRIETGKIYTQIEFKRDTFPKFTARIRGDIFPISSRSANLNSFIEFSIGNFERDLRGLANLAELGDKLDALGIVNFDFTEENLEELAEEAMNELSNFANTLIISGLFDAIANDPNNPLDANTIRQIYEDTFTMTFSGFQYSDTEPRTITPNPVLGFPRQII